LRKYNIEALERGCLTDIFGYNLLFDWVMQVLLRFPNGERKERRFMSDAKVRLLYDYVDSLGMFDGVDYHLLSNFPRTVYDQLDLTLKSAGLHPQASLYVHVDDK
jgi:FAS-associated factor 2